MLGGVTIEPAETVVIDADVRIGMDTVIEPFAQVLGKTVIGADCRIGACSIVRDSELADGVEIGPFTIVAHRGWSAACMPGRSRGCAWKTWWRKARTSATSWS